MQQPRSRIAGLLALAALAPCMLGAQPSDPARVARIPEVRRALDSLRATNAWTLDQQVSICEVAAPSFKEQARAQELKRRFEQLGLRNVRIDAEGNVIGERPGTTAGAPTVVVSGHLDTVFPEGTDVRVKRDTAPDGSVRLTAPGISDDCRGLAVLLAVARALDAANVRTPGTIIFAGTVGEEGVGNSRGARRLVDETLKGKIDYFISVDESMFELTHRAVGSNRYRVTFSGPGGHSYSAFGMPNPSHALGRAIAKIADFKPATRPRTTFSVGILRGGQTVNSIPAEVSFDIDMRSESPNALAALDRDVRRAINDAVTAERKRWPRSTVALTARIDTLGIRPAGSQPLDAPIVRTALEAARALGEKAVPTASSTDANVPMARGIPAITMGSGGRHFGEHSLSEHYEDGPRGWAGAQWVTILVTALSGVR